MSLLAFLVACAGEAETGTPRETAIPTACPPDSPYDWDNLGSPFLTVWCDGCHGSQVPEPLRYGAPLGVDFDTLDGARMWSERIQARAVDAAEMPPGGFGPPEAERAKLGEWIACGMPDT